MIDFNEIAQIAYFNKPLPEYPSQAEQFAYLSMRSLYNDFRKGNVKKEQAQQERNQIKKAFDNAAENEKSNLEYFKRVNRIRVALAGFSKEVEAGTCDRCKTLMRIFDGRMK